ncbi:MAG: hypothetical protein MJD61_04950 [Proteobacteria bacterium]|nr:hypothetical protein [Pseudomonadota bacterium]
MSEHTAVAGEPIGHDGCVLEAEGIEQRLWDVDGHVVALELPVALEQVASIRVWSRGVAHDVSPLGLTAGYEAMLAQRGR